MSEVEAEPQFTSLKDRINALNQQKAAATTTFGKRAPPPIPSARPSSVVTTNTNTHTNAAPNPIANRPHPPSRTQTINNPPLPTIGSAVNKADNNLPNGKPALLPPPPVERDQGSGGMQHVRGRSPAVPARNGPPALPGRKASQPGLPIPPPRNEERRGSNGSVVSYNSSTVSLSRTRTGGSTTSASSVETGSRKLPPVFQAANLPPLPPSRKQTQLVEEKSAAVVVREVKAPLVTTKSAPVVPIRPPPVVERDLMPKLPSRPQPPPRTSSVKVEEPTPVPASRKLPPVTAPTPRNPLTMGFSNKYKPNSTSLDTRKSSTTTNTSTPSSTPPPIPLSSKPSTSAITAVINRPPPPPRDDCLTCRDFSLPDRVASMHPRTSLPRHGDVAGHLANVLCSSFPSYTDKARAIFTWCHHNIEYDTYSFFNKCVKHQEPADAITSGLAVCAGYASAYAAIALKAGLECVVVGGHGKGYGHNPLGPHDSIPPFKGNHAWNAIRVDDGEWKLLDACWGAGHLGADNNYNKKFDPAKFTMSNEDFGLEHYPEDARHFYRADGGRPTWEEYFVGPKGRNAQDPPTVYGIVEEDYGFSKQSFTPDAKEIVLRNYSPTDVLRFQWSNICPHWNHPKRSDKGKHHPYMLVIGGVDGRKEAFVPIETNGFWWWCDVRVKDLGCRGKEVKVVAVLEVSGKSARGMTNRQFVERGNVGYNCTGVATWMLV